jgi:hypothetical protein
MKKNPTFAAGLAQEIGFASAYLLAPVVSLV